MGFAQFEQLVLIGLLDHRTNTRLQVLKSVPPHFLLIFPFLNPVSNRQRHYKVPGPEAV